jgi:hypothetical protein
VKLGKLNFTTMANILEGAAVLTGTFSIHDKSVKILSDSDATHSFINEESISNLGQEIVHTKDAFLIVTTIGKVPSNTVCTRVPLQLGALVIKTHLVTLKLGSLDIILGMNWMEHHKVILDIAKRVIDFRPPTAGHTTLYLPSHSNINPSFYAVVAFPLESISVICEYADVLPDELLQPGTAPISKRAYHMPPKELAELKS